MSQGDSIYDFVDKRDHAAWQSNLTHAGLATNPSHWHGRREMISDRHRTAATTAVDRSFCCRMFRARNSRRLPPAWTEHKVAVKLRVHVRTTSSACIQTFSFCTNPLSNRLHKVQPVVSCKHGSMSHR